MCDPNQLDETELDRQQTAQGIFVQRPYEHSHLANLLEIEVTPDSNTWPVIGA